MRSLMLAAAAVALLAGPALAKKSTATTTTATAPVGNTMVASTSTTAKPAKGTNKMSICAAQWKALGAGQTAYDTKAKTMKSKKGGSVSGYNVFTGECMKKKA